MALTGTDAIKAVQTMMRVGQADARFNGPKLLRAIRTGHGRRLVIAGIRLGRAVMPPNPLARFRPTSRPPGSDRRSRRLTAPPGGSARPRREDPPYIRGLH